MTSSYSHSFLDQPPSIDELEHAEGVTLLEFGTDWCGHCLRAQTPLMLALEGVKINHLKLLDGKGKRLGRHFKVKLWPTLILLNNGEEIARCVRPTETEDIKPLLQYF